MQPLNNKKEENIICEKIIKSAKRHNHKTIYEKLHLIVQYEQWIIHISKKKP